jgi:hypothetical protein
MVGVARGGRQRAPPRAVAQRVRERVGAAGEPLAERLDALERHRESRATIARPDPTLTRRFVARARALRGAPG